MTNETNEVVTATDPIREALIKSADAVCQTEDDLGIVILAESTGDMADLVTTWVIAAGLSLVQAATLARLREDVGRRLDEANSTQRRNRPQSRRMAPPSRFMAARAQ